GRLPSGARLRRRATFARRPGAFHQPRDESVRAPPTHLAAPRAGGVGALEQLRHGQRRTAGPPPNAARSAAPLSAVSEKPGGVLAMTSRRSKSSSAMSLKKRLGVRATTLPRVARCLARQRYSLSLARVMET